MVEREEGMSTSDSPRGKNAKGGRPRRYMVVPLGRGWAFGFFLVPLGCVALACVGVDEQWVSSALERWRIPVDEVTFLVTSLFVGLVMAMLGGRWVAAKGWLTIDEKGMTLVGWLVKRRTIYWSQPIKVRRWVSIHEWAVTV